MLRRSDSGRLGRFVAVASLAAACSGGGSSSETASTRLTAVETSVAPSAPPDGTAGEPPSDRVCQPAPRADCSLTQSFDPPVAAAADLTGIDLRGAVLGDDVNLSNATLTGAQLDGATIRGSLKGADLTNASLVRADLSASNLAGATLTGATLTGALVNASVVERTICLARRSPTSLLGFAAARHWPVPT